jgi:signal transduction histidine kinase
MGSPAGPKWLASIVLFAMWSVCANSAGQTPRNILLVYEEAQAVPAAVQLQAALLRSLRGHLGHLELYQEQIDKIRFPGESATRIDELRSRHADRKIDALIHVGSVPSGSAVEFRVPTAWEQYRWRIIGTVALIVLQFILISGLLIQRFRRRRAEKSLRDMTGRLLQTQDDERRRIARDLHEGTGQHLSGIALSIGQVLADFPPDHDRLRHLLQGSHVASRQALNEIRAVSYALHPPILDGLGLVPALQWYLDGLKKQTSLQIHFDARADLSDATPDTQRTLFRIVQECVTNTLRHSGGAAMKVRLLDTERRILLEIEDDGYRMSAEELQRAAGAASLGVGIAGMRERVRQLDGTFNITSGPRGTRVSVSLPAHEEHYAAHPPG